MANTQQGLKPGAMLRHQTYRIERMLGQGGFGITYLATDLNLDRLVAIKEFFPKDYCERESTTSHVSLGTQSASEFVNKLKAKFLKEARNIAKFDHPGIIKIHAAFEENNTAYYVMDFIEGESLSEMVKHHGPLQGYYALRYMEKIGEALEYVHSKKINHLDIKPANIMVRRSDDNPILIDFGLSKQYDSTGNQTSTTPTGISHGFAPMEQYNDGGVKEFSPQTDIYSLAATLYYILSGVTPPQAPKLIEDELTFPASISPLLINPISKAMSPKRSARYGTVSAFIEDLRDPEVKEEKVKPAEVKEETEFSNQPDTRQPDSTSAPKSSKRKLWVGVCIAVAVIAIIFIAIPRGKKVDPASLNDSIVAEVAQLNFDVSKVDEMYWKSPLGIASYSGEVKPDSVSGKKIPHGKGVAEITAGEFKGSIYDGEFVNGNMEGEAHYTRPNGDTFVGTFKNNKYHQGRYTIKATGEYFEGAFKNGDPDERNGNWYNSKGKRL